MRGFNLFQDLYCFPLEKTFHDILLRIASGIIIKKGLKIVAISDIRVPKQEDCFIRRSIVKKSNRAFLSSAVFILLFEKKSVVGKGEISIKLDLIFNSVFLNVTYA